MVWTLAEDAAETRNTWPMVLVECREEKCKKLLEYRGPPEKFAVYHPLLKKTKVIRKELIAIIKRVGTHLHPDRVKFAVGK